MVETRARDPPGTRITIQTGIRGKFQWVMKDQGSLYDERVQCVTRIRIHLGSSNHQK